MKQPLLLFNAVALYPAAPRDWLVAAAAAAAIGASLLLGYVFRSPSALLPVVAFVVLSMFFTPFFYFEVVNGPPEGQLGPVPMFLAIYSAD